MGGNVYRNKEVNIDIHVLCSELDIWADRHQTYTQQALGIQVDGHIGRQILSRQAARQVGWQAYRQVDISRQIENTYTYYRLFRYLAPPYPKPKPIYSHDHTSILDLHADFQITNLIYLLHVMWFLSGIKHCCENILLYFWGCYNQNGHRIVNN